MFMNIAIKPDTKEMLKEKKITPSQSFDDVIKQLLKRAPEDIWSK